MKKKRLKLLKLYNFITYFIHFVRYYIDIIKSEQPINLNFYVALVPLILLIHKVTCNRLLNTMVFHGFQIPNNNTTL